MKIILSRKGFDSSAGGMASPIFPDGTAISLPIPTRTPSAMSFRTLNTAKGTVGSLVEALSRGRVLGNAECHLDPDLDRACLPRTGKWRPAFGQVGAAQSHLERQGVGEGDLFLFFGWFRAVKLNRAGKWSYVPDSRDVHRFFGYLQIGEVLGLGSDPAQCRRRRPELASHPHFQGAWPANNTVYVAADALTIDGGNVGAPGAGLLAGPSERLTLTAPTASRRGCWRLPHFLLPSTGTPLSYHRDPQRWRELDGCAELQVVARGQEFVFDATRNEAALAWLCEFFDEVRVHESHL